MEKWKQLDIYDGRYWISDMANFRTTYNHFSHKRIPGFNKSILLATHKANYLGHKAVQFTINEKVTKGAHKGKNKRKGFIVHVLVAKSFVPNPLKYSGLSFIDNDRSNPIATNLKWVERGRDRIFKNMAEQDEYLNALNYKKLDWQDKRIYNYLKGDDKALDSLFRNKRIKQYLGKVVINAGLWNRYLIKDIISDAYIVFFNHIKEGRYRIVHNEQKNYVMLAYLSKLVTYGYYQIRRKQMKEPRLKNAEVNEKYLHFGNRNHNLYNEDSNISSEIAELFNEYN